MLLLDYECQIRLASFLGLLFMLAAAEWAAPRRRQSRLGARQLSNLGLAALNTVAVRFLVPLSAVGAAFLAESRGWGLLNHFPLPAWLATLLALVVLDAAIYLQHVLFHAIPLLWRLHRVHHADRELDVTSGVRFHTLEILLSAFLKIAVVAALGAPAAAVVLFEVLLNATSLFNHGNLRLPEWLDRALRLVLVTPDMHRVHHSVEPAEANSNFGFNLPWWDYLFGTYQAQPAAGHERMELGVRGWDGARVSGLPGMLAMPFVTEAAPAVRPTLPPGREPAHGARF